MLNKLDMPLHQYYNDAMNNITDIRDMVNTLNIQLLETIDFIGNITDEDMYRTNIPKIKELIKDIDNKYCVYIERISILYQKTEEYLTKLVNDTLPKKAIEYVKYNYLIKNSIVIKNTDKIFYLPIEKDENIIFEEILIGNVSIVKLFTEYFGAFLNFADKVKQKFDFNNRVNYISKLKNVINIQKMDDLIDNLSEDYDYTKNISGIIGYLNILKETIVTSNIEAIESTNNTLTRMHNNEILYTEIFLSLKGNIYKI